MAGVDEVEHEVPFRDGKPPIPVKVLFAPNASKTPNFQGRALVGVVLAHGAGGDMDSGHLPRMARHLVEEGGAAAVVRFTCKPPHLPTRVAAFKAVLQAAKRVWPETRGIARWVCAGHSMGGRAAVEVAHEAWLQQGEGAGGQEPRGGQEMKQHKGRAQQQQRKQKQKKEEGKEEAEAGQEGGAKKRRTGGGHGEEEGVSGAVGAGAEVGDALTSAGGQQGGAGNGGKGGGNAEGKQQDVKEEQQQQQRGKEEAKGTEADGLQQDADELAPRRRSTRAAATKASAALRAGAVPTAAGGTKTDGRRSNQSCSGPATAAAGSSDQSKEGGRGQGALASTAGAPGETAATTEGQLPRVVGVLLLSYPLHPPGNTADLRDTPLADLRLPVLFVRGTRDEFSTQPHFDTMLARMRSGGRSDQVQVHQVEGGDHGLAVRGVAAKQARGAGAKKGGADSKTAGEGGGAGPLDVALEAVVRWIKEL